MPKPRFFYPSSKGRNAYFRRPYPDDVCHRLGRKEFKKSLGTGNWQEIEPKYAKAYDEYLHNVAEARKSPSGKIRMVLPRAEAVAPKNNLLSGELRHLAAQWFTDEGLSEPPVLDPSEHEDYLAGLAEEAVGLKLGDQQEAIRITTRLLQDAGADAMPGSPQFLELCGLIQRGQIASLEYRRYVADGFRGNGITDPFFAALANGHQHSVQTSPASPHLRAHQSSHTFAQLLDSYLDYRKEKGLAGKTKLEDEVSVRTLRDAIGADTLAQDVDYAKCLEASRLLQSLPTYYRRKYPKVALRDIPALAKRDGAKSLDAKTVNKYLNFLSGALEHGKERLRWVNTNTATGLMLPVDKGRRTRQPYTHDDIETLLRSMVFTSPRNVLVRTSRKGTATKNCEDHYWIILIGMFAGMRENEICQLDVADISNLPVNDKVTKSDDNKPVEEVPIIEVRRSADKKIKNAQSARDVPIHPELQRLGFLKFVDARKRTGAKKLFEATSPGATGYYSNSFSKWYGRYLDKNGLTSSALTFHSLRHGFTDALRDAGVRTSHINKIMGWRNEGQSSEYGRGLQAKVLADEIKKATYAGIEIPDLGLTY